MHWTCRMQRGNMRVLSLKVKTSLRNVRFEVLTLEQAMFTALQDVTSYRLVDGYRCFRKSFDYLNNMAALAYSLL